MKIVYEYSHLGGAEILKVRYPAIEQEIYDVIAEVTAPRTKISNEKTKKGKTLFSPKSINQGFRDSFGKRGFKELRDSYTIELPNYDLKIKGAYKQVDFSKQNVLVEVQLGKYFSMFYDLAKFQYFFNENRADVGVEIVPCHPLHKEMSSGVAYGEQLVFDIERLKRHFPAVPTKVVLIHADEAEAPVGEVVEPEDEQATETGEDES